MASRKHTTPAVQLDLSLPPEEEWRPIPGYEGRYQVSNLGRVRSLERLFTVTGKRGVYVKRNPARMMRLKVSQPHRYLSVVLFREGQHREWLVHHLVLMAFVGPRPQGMVCNHLDSNRQNNTPNNLEWVTQFDNRQHSIRKGRWHPFLLRGEKTSWAKLTATQVREIRARVAQGTSRSVLSREFGITLSTISDIVRRKNWRHVD